jgi:hypothetical protein
MVASRSKRTGNCVFLFLLLARIWSKGRSKGFIDWPYFRTASHKMETQMIWHNRRCPSFATSSAGTCVCLSGVNWRLVLQWKTWRRGECVTACSHTVSISMRQCKISLTGRGQAGSGCACVASVKNNSGGQISRGATTKNGIARQGSGAESGS